MARGVNKVIIVGNLGDNPDVRHTANGSVVTNLSVATSESWRDRQNGQMVERTEWHRVVIFGKLAEIAGQYLHKGSKVYIEGKLQTRKWQDKQGQDRYTTEIVIDINGQMQMLDRREGSAESMQQPVSGINTINNANTANTGQPQLQPSANVPFGDSNFGQPQPQTTPQGMQKQPTTPVSAPTGFDDFDDDIPF